MENWQGLNIFQEAVLPNIFAIAIITCILLVVSIIYFIQNKNVRADQEPKRFTLMVDSVILTVRQMVVDTFGIKFVKFTPYFLFLISFLILSNIFGIFGMKEPTSSYSVPLSLGLITWITSIVCAIKYQKLNYLKSFFIHVKIKENKIPVMINPLHLIGVITPLISLTFRLWGNIIAGYVIFAVIFWAVSSLLPSAPFAITLLVGGVLIMPFIIFYFSMFAGIIQAYVFTLLSMTYISTPILEGIEMQEEAEKLLILKQEQESKSKE
ncbi:MAG: F0F1 ATP synthase subunit A [Mycoplasma sp.]